MSQNYELKGYSLFMPSAVGKLIFLLKELLSLSGLMALPKELLSLSELMALLEELPPLSGLIALIEELSVLIGTHCSHRRTSCPYRDSVLSSKNFCPYRNSLSSTERCVLIEELSFLLGAFRFRWHGGGLRPHHAADGVESGCYFFTTFTALPFFTTMLMPFCIWSVRTPLMV